MKLVSINVSLLTRRKGLS